MSKKIVITGGLGYIGMELSLLLSGEARKNNIKVIDNSFFSERVSQPEKFSSIPETMWWGLITLTTVGYGDVSPVTPLGKIIGAFTAIMGVCTVALLTGIVASAFANQRAQKAAILEAEINQALSDGVISDEEALKIEKLRKELNLSPEHSKSLIDILSDKNIR